MKDGTISGRVGNAERTGGNGAAGEQRRIATTYELDFI